MIDSNHYSSLEAVIKINWSNECVLYRNVVGWKTQTATWHANEDLRSEGRLGESYGAVRRHTYFKRTAISHTYEYILVDKLCLKQTLLRSTKGRFRLIYREGKVEALRRR